MSLPRQGLRFLLVGSLNFLVSASVFWVCLRLFQDAAATAGISQVLAYASGVAVSFLLNRIWTFSATAAWGRQLAAFLGVQAGLLVATAIALHALVDVGAWPAAPAWLLVMSVATIINFLLLRHFVFAVATP